jgi:hypothetical protein
VTLEAAQLLRADSKPRTLARFVLFVLAANADPDGVCAIGDAELMAQLSMRVDRFSRILEDLQAEGRIRRLDLTRIRVYAGGQQGAAVGVVPQTSLLPNSAVEGTGGVGEGDSSAAPSGGRTAVSEVLSFYDETFEKHTDWGEDDRREVRAALEIKSVADLKKAIVGNKLSGFHQGENDRRKKYNTLSHIIRGKQGKKTRREVIDYFIGVFEEHKGAGGSVVDREADPAIIRTRKEEIRRAHRLPGDEEALERSRRAEVWLEERGIKTNRKPDGYPVWGGGEE